MRTNLLTAALIAAALIAAPEFALAETATKPTLQTHTTVIASDATGTDGQKSTLMQLNF